MGSADVTKTLESARQDLQQQEKVMLEQKTAFIKEVRGLLHDRMDRAISEIVTDNASRVNELHVDELREMKSALALEKNKAVEKGVLALESADWLWCGSPSSESSNDPIGWFGVNEQGTIWQSLQNCSKDMEAIFKTYGLQADERMATYSFSRFRVNLPRKEINEAVGKVHREYCNSKYKVTSLERQLKEAKAQEKYDSV